jgi:hypothetical protein
MKMLSRRRIANSQFSGILTKIRTIKKKQKKFSRKLERPMLSYQIKKRDKYLTNMEKKVSIPAQHQDNNKIILVGSQDTTKVSIISTCDQDSVLLMQMKFSDEHLVVETPLKISLEMMTTSLVEISGEAKIIIIAKTSKDVWIRLEWEEEAFLMMMTSLVLALEGWVAFRALRSLLLAVWVQGAQA